MSVRTQARASFPPVVLFDLDGTLLDSAPDMLATVNRMRVARGQLPMRLEQIRPHVSEGARAMSAAAFPALAAQDIAALVPEFLAIYAEELGLHGRPFPGVETVLHALEAAGSGWGIVTNKPEGLARALVALLGWQQRCAVLIGGDTLAQCKPHPLPLLEAARRFQAQPADCVYVGDDARDIQAARAAGMPSIAALWGDDSPHDHPRGWHAGAVLSCPGDLLQPTRWPRVPAVA